MKHLTFSVFLIFLCCYSFSQSLSKLDEKNGYKSFKLGDSYSKHSSNLKNHHTSKDGSFNVYSYTGYDSDLKKVFTYSFDDVWVYFSRENKLIGVTLFKNYSFGDYQYDHSNKSMDVFFDIGNSFKALFGAPSQVLNNADDIDKPDFQTKWLSTNVTLTVACDYLGMKKGSLLEVNLFDKNYFSSLLDSGF